MKDKLLHILFLWAVWLTLPACSDRVEELEPDSSIKVSLGITTRAVEQEGKEVGDGLPQSLKVWIYGVKGSEEETLLAYIEEDATDESQIFNDGTDIYGNPIEVLEQKLEEGKKYEALNFYVVLNDDAVTWTNNASLDKNTTSGKLKTMTFSLLTGTFAPTTDNEQLMYGESDLEIVPSKTHYEVEIPVERSVAKMELYFTKLRKESNLGIKSITLSSPLEKGYLCSKSLDDGETIYSQQASPVNLLTTGLEVNTFLSAEGYYGDFSKYEANFTQSTLLAPYLLENPNGLSWTSHQTDDKYPESEGQIDNSKCYRLSVNYEIDLTQDEEIFYLPQIERNHLYKIYIRVRSTKFDLNWEVVPFDNITNDVPTFN